MVKHIIIWQLGDHIPQGDKSDVLKNIKTHLEALQGQIPGLVSIKVTVDFLPTANSDAILESEFESFEALKNYSVHPLHVAVAEKYVRGFTKTRSCADYEIN